MARGQLNEKQQAVYDWIEAWWSQFGVGPTVREIAAEFEVSVGGAQLIASELDRHGWILRDADSARSIRPAQRSVSCDCPHCGGEVEMIEEFEK